MNWGRTITLAFILFAGFIGSMVVFAFTKDADLIRDDYYESELQYDVDKEKQMNYNKLEGQLSISQEPEGVVLQLPNPVSKSSNGTVHFYRPDKKKYDRSFELKVDEKGVQLFDYDDFREGRYEVKVEWTENGKSYLGSVDILF